MKLKQLNILLPFPCLILAITIVSFAFFSPCQAEEPDIAEHPSGEEAQTQAITTGIEEMSAVDQRKAEEEKARVSVFSLIPHRQNYFLLINYESHPNTSKYENAGQDVPKNYEAKFQLSFKIRVWKTIFGNNGDLFFAYTQRSFWQLYDKALSSPFRETNYEPEMFLQFNTDFNTPVLKNRFFLIGLNHQSNGRGEPLSRSWNRIFGAFVAERGNLAIALKPWYRIPEREEEDDNPNIEKYMGYGELVAAYRLKGHVLSLMLRNNLRGNENKGAVELGWSYPVTRKVRLYVQYFNGYGESLVDYNETTNRIGFGVMLNDWI